MNVETIIIPEPTLRRLPKYVHLLERWKKEDKQYVSSSMVADELGLDSIQVRKDLSFAGLTGKPKIGFELNELLPAIKHILNWDNIEEAFLVGVGSLGEAILGYQNFKNYGLNIIAAFDNNPKKIGKKRSSVEILNVDKLLDLTKRMHINIGIITVPANVAQQTADIMIEGGMTAIWNFAPVHLKVPENIIVENAQLSLSLGVLTHKLSTKMKVQNK
ncbi:MAG: redox-sensing transcriptional repressor Rex [Ignavibacteria bacterium]|jgi:redox-sensing transcriptional repressor